MGRRVWEVSLHQDVEAWYLSICQNDPKTADLILQAVDLLAAEGPSLGRPLVDRIKGSSYHNMKELRPASAGVTEVRILFAFDPGREAISSWSPGTSRGTGKAGTARPYRLQTSGMPST
jgi:hypothetical protein